MERTPEDEVIILACDGLWDVFKSEDAIDTIRQIYQEGETRCELVAEEMCDLSLIKGMLMYLFKYIIVKRIIF